MMPYKCKKCGAWMQWRYNYGQSYWICSQCGYSPEFDHQMSNSTKGYEIKPTASDATGGVDNV